MIVSQGFSSYAGVQSNSSENLRQTVLKKSRQPQGNPKTVLYDAVVTFYLRTWELRDDEDLPILAHTTLIGMILLT